MIVHGKNAKVLLNGVDISGDLNSITPKLSNNLVSYATFGVTGYKHLPGLGSDEVSYDALFNSTSADIVNTLRTLTSTGYQMMVWMSSTTGAYVFAANEVKIKDHTLKSVVTDINRYTANFVTHDLPFAPSILLTAGLETTTGAGNGTTCDTGIASSSSGGEAFAQVTAVPGATFAVSIQHSSTGAVWTTLDTFPYVSTGQTGTARLIFSGTLYQYIRATYGAAATFAVAFHRY